MAGSRQDLTCSFMRACLRCLPLVDTYYVLLYVPAAVDNMLLLYCGWLWCGYYCCPCARRNRRNIDVEKTRTRRNYKNSVESKEKLERSPK